MGYSSLDSKPNVWTSLPILTDQSSLNLLIIDATNLDDTVDVDKPCLQGISLEYPFL